MIDFTIAKEDAYELTKSGAYYDFLVTCMVVLDVYLPQDFDLLVVDLRLMSRNSCHHSYTIFHELKT